MLHLVKSDSGKTSASWMKINFLHILVWF